MIWMWTLLVLLLLLNLVLLVLLAKVHRSKKGMERLIAACASDGKRLDLSVVLGEKASQGGSSTLLLSRLRTLLQDSFNKLQKVVMAVYDFDRNFHHFAKFQLFTSMRGNVISGRKSVFMLQEGCHAQDRSINRVAEISRRLYSFVEELTASSNEISGKAEVGMEDMRSMDENVSEVKREMQNMLTVSTNLSDQANSVRAVVDSITNIAEQTNLLALNASIEAARAGDAGRGFAVVAEEVRKLADESKSVAGRIIRIIDELAQNIDGSLETTRSVSSRTDRFAEEIARVVDAISGVLAGMRSINEATGDVAHMTQEMSQLSSALQESSRKLVESSDDALGDIDKIEEVIKPMEETIQDLAGKIHVTSEMTEEIIRLLAVIRLNDNREFTSFAQSVIQRHKDFVDKLHAGVDSGGFFDLEGNPNRCKLGVFFNLIPKPNCISQRLWDETISIHERFHPLYHKVLDAVMGSDTARARQLCHEADLISHEIIRNLEAMIQTCAGRQGAKGSGVKPLALKG
ncbi:MAG: hypothetical protein GX256_02190 [Fretibacterium sp.]|nr:hypothetical protein [Fretibacterium sp.]